MNGEDKDDLIERVLVGESTPEDQAFFDQWIATDPEFREVYHFRKNLATQLRIKRRNELKTNFRQIREELKAKEESEAGLPVIPLWRKPRVLVAASVVFLVAFFLVFRKSLLPERSGNVAAQDTTNFTKDSIPFTPKEEEITSNPSENNTKKPADSFQFKELPLYETDDLSLGFGKNDPATGVLPVLFFANEKWLYDFEDTMKIYLPRSEWSREWIVIYIPSRDEYLLGDSRESYSITRGLKGLKSLKKSNSN